MNKIYTIGFTKKSAQSFFNTLKSNNVDILVDIRLNNTSQLSGFAKFPDIQYFLNEICNIKYIYDGTFSPTETLLKGYRKKSVTWEAYEENFEEIMISRDIEKHINENYLSLSTKNICLLCSEATAEKCHRRLVALHFSELLKLSIIHL